MSAARHGLLRSLPAVLIALLGVSCLLTPDFRVLGQRGALRLADGFRPGRWDAAFVVTRGRAELVLPEEPLRIRLLLSGPARVLVRAGTEMREVALTGGAPQPLEVVLPRGGNLALVPDGPVRLHEARLFRTEPVPWRRVALLLAVGIAGAALAWRGRAAAVLGPAISLVAMWLTLRGSLAGVCAASILDRTLPAVALLCLAALPLLPLRRLPRPSGRGSAASPWPAVFAGLLLLSCLAQTFTTEQPLLLGDQAAYHEIGGRFRDALLAVRGIDSLADALQILRPYAGLWLTGLVYGGLRALRDGLAAIYVAHALAIAGCGFFLVRAAARLGGKPAAVTTGLLALSYSTYPVLCGLVTPEPFVLFAWSFAFERLLAATEAADESSGAAAGFGFGAGFAFHPQGMWFLLFAMLLVLLPFARTLVGAVRRPSLRAFGAGLLPVLLWTAAGEAYARPVTPVLDERHGFWAFTAPFPIGFWLAIDTDGWLGPMRIDDTRYARELGAAEKSGIVQGGLGRLSFTAGFVAENARASLRTVLRNLHRLFDRPDNPPRSGLLLPYPLQVFWHRALLLLFLVGTAAAAATRAGFLYVPFAALAMTYPLYHVMSKYSVPATPFLLLGAALTLVTSVAGRRFGLLAAVAVASGARAFTPAELAALGLSAPLARGLLLAAYAAGLAAAFWLAGRSWARDARSRGLAALAFATLLVPWLAAEWSSPDWRRFAVKLDVAAEHEIVLAPADLDKLGSVREAYLALDLELPSGDTRGLELRFASGLVVPGAELRPSMPSFGLATTRFHHDPRGVRQWWRLPWRPEMASTGKLRVSVRGNSRDRLFGELAADPGVARGPSLGQWPYLSVYRLMYDGEYRLATEQPLLGVARQSWHNGRLLDGVLGVRLVALDDDASVARVETAPVPKAAREVVTAVWARLSTSSPARLTLPNQDVIVALGARGTLAKTGMAEVRFVPTGEGEGWFLLRTPAAPDQPLTLTFSPLQEMTSPPRFVRPEIRATPPIPLDWTAAPYVPLAKVTLAKVEPWTLAGVY